MTRHQAKRAQSVWTTAVWLYVLAIVVLDLADGRRLALIAPLVAAPLLAAAVLPAIRTLAIAVGATSGALALSVYDQGLAYHRWLRTGVVVGGSALAIVLAHRRAQQERVVQTSVSESQRAQDALQASETRYRTLIECLPDTTVLLVDCELRIHPVQDSVVSGWSVAEFAGKRLDQVLPAERAAELAAAVRRAFAGERVGLDWSDRRSPLLWAVDLVRLPTDHGDPAVVMVVARDISERRRLEAERAALAGQIIAALENERRQLAGDLHDDAIQALAAAQMRLGAVATKASDPGVVHDLQPVAETLEYAMRACRTFLFNLRPPLLDLHGLPAAVQQQLDRVAEQTGGTVELDWTVAERLAEDAKMVLFRTVQEALANVSKHAKPCKVVVRARQRGDTVTVQIVDDGVGFDPDQVAREKPLLGHLGLPAMAERVRLAGGRLMITSQPGQGTRISIIIPIGSVQL